MKDHPVKIEKVKLQDICNFARGALNQPSYRTVVPISMRRACSQAKNPYGRPEDIALLVAFSADRCVGYHGLLPGLLKHGRNLHRVHWATTFYVAPEFRNRKIGKRLLAEIKKLKLDFIVTQMTASAERAYRNSGYQDIGGLVYFQLRADRLDFTGTVFNSLNQLLQKRRRAAPPLKGLQRLHRALYRGAKSVFYRTAANNQRSAPHRFEWQVVERIDESRRQPDGTGSNRPSFFRGIEALNWMLHYPWVVSKKLGEKKAQNYYFSDVQDIFQYAAIELYRIADRRPAGFMVLSLSHKRQKTRVKLLDFHLENSEDVEIVGYLVLKYAQKCLADRIEYPEDLAGYFQTLPWTKKLIKKQRRLYLCHLSGSNSPLADLRSNIRFDYCDGDTAFAS